MRRMFEALTIIPLRSARPILLQLQLQVPLLLLLIAPTPLRAVSIKLRDNPLGISYDPAPPPDKGPPLSAGALRDPAYLPAEIGGIFGAYILIVIIVVLALFTVGRRLRRETDRAKRSLEVEMIKAPQHISTSISPTSPTSPRSPTTNFSRPSDKTLYIHPGNTQSQVAPASHLSVDARVVAADRQTMDKGLEDLYTHVLAHEDAKMRSRTESLASGSQPPLSPQSQRSMPLPVNFPAEQPQRPGPKPAKGRPQGMTLDTSARTIKPRSRASSIISSLKSPRKKNGGRNMQISSPLPTPLSQTFSADYPSDEEPLSPASIPPPPPVPEGQRPYTHSRNASSNDFDSQSHFASASPESPYSPITPRPDPIEVRPQLGKKSSGSLRDQHPFSPLTPVFPNSPLTPRPDQMEQLQNPGLKKPVAVAPEQPFSPLSPIFPASPLAIRHAPANSANPKLGSAFPLNSNPLPRASAPSLAPTNNSTRTLPFRAFDPPAGATSPTLSHTKTTVLERSNPLSPGSKTPWTGASVPYSPYQPHTPVTPFSPRLVTKHERKLRKKIDGRTPVVEMCKSEGELWDSAY